MQKSRSLQPRYESALISPLVTFNMFVIIALNFWQSFVDHYPLLESHMFGYDIQWVVVTVKSVHNPSTQNEKSPPHPQFRRLRIWCRSQVSKSNTAISNISSSACTTRTRDNMLFFLLVVINKSIVARFATPFAPTVILWMVRRFEPDFLLDERELIDSRFVNALAHIGFETVLFVFERSFKRRKRESQVSKTAPNVGVGVRMNSHNHLSNCGWERGVTRSSPVNSSRICSKLCICSLQSRSLVTQSPTEEKDVACQALEQNLRAAAMLLQLCKVHLLILSHCAPSHDVIEGIAKTIVTTMAGHNIESVLPPQTATMSNYHQRQKRRNEIRQVVQTYILICTKTPCSIFGTYVKAKDLDLWHIIFNGDFPPLAKNEVTKSLEVVPFEEQYDDLKKKLAKNNEAKMVLYNALLKKEYERIFMCKTAKDIWQSLLITHQAKVMAIEESKDLTSLALDDLIGNLKVHEVVMEKDSEIYRGKNERVKSIALKAKKVSSDDETLTSGSDGEEYVMAVRNFKKFFRRNGKFVRQPKEEKKSFRQRDEKKGKSDRKCFRCGDPNHLIGDCLKPTRNKDQKAFIRGSWSDSENDVEDKTNDETCLIAQSSNRVTLNFSYYSDNASSLDNDTMQIEYDSLCEISLKIVNKN
ncbi:zf-CCHC domain-containing protein [Tanacetum coccineum]